jgi:hypothetical protein
MTLLATSRRHPLFSALVAYTLPLILHPVFHQAALALTGLNGGSLGSFFYASALYSITSLTLLSFLFSLHAMTLSPDAAPQWHWATPSILDAYLIHCRHTLPANAYLALYYRAPTSVRFLFCFLTLSATCTALSALYSAPASAASILQLCWYLGICKTCQHAFFNPPHPSTQLPDSPSTPATHQASSKTFHSPSLTPHTPDLSRKSSPVSPITVCKNLVTRVP